ncbi:hypothetical protein LSAT2_027376 [Lamellibrachia satsuma]|nr:hypothetical protein LSAT2_027376 [Lamellibrachia satsuma]
MSRCLNKRTFWLTCIFLIMFGSFVALLGNIYIIGDADDYFRHVLDETDSRDLLETLRVLATTLDSANLTYFLLFGTLIGSYRHHGRIPWDDDIDIMADVTQKPQIREALLRCQPKYTLQVSPQNGTYSQHVWKFYKADGYKYPHRQHRWPFVDLTFFRSNDTHVYHDYKGLTPVFNFKKTLVFPLKRRPFESMQLPAPCETEKMLKMQYTNLDVCKSKNHNHRHEVAYPSFMRYSLPCSSLKQKFPFVERTEEMGSTRETLRLGHWTINTVLIPPCRGR